VKKQPKKDAQAALKQYTRSNPFMPEPVDDNAGPKTPAKASGRGKAAVAKKHKANVKPLAPKKDGLKALIDAHRDPWESLRASHRRKLAKEDEAARMEVHQKK
jgi:hypothetical protein